MSAQNITQNNEIQPGNLPSGDGKNNKLAKNFGFWSLAGFALPTMMMMLITSLYSVTDAAFVSRLVSTDALSSVNIVFPVINVIIGVGVMLATGGSAIIARKLGEKKSGEARQNFTFLILIGIGIGILIAAVGSIFLRPIVRALGASDLLMEDGVKYLGVMILFAPVTITQLVFENFFVASGKPRLGMFLALGAGLTNALLDFVFIYYFHMGVRGAAISTGIAQCVPIAVGLFLYLGKKNSIHFVRPKGTLRFVGECCFNGSSELVSNLSMGLTTFLFNLQMMKFVGENGVAAVTIVMCAQFILTSMLMGYSMGVAPVISYNYGKGDTKLLRKVVKNSLIFVTAVSVVTAIASPFLSPFIIDFFTDVPAVRRIAMEGVFPYSFCFLFCGINIFASALYTAFSNGKISAFLSFLRTCVLLSAGILALPAIFGEIGVWCAVPIAELLSLVFSVVFLKRSRKLYRY